MPAEVRQALSRANDAVIPSTRVAADVPGSIWWVNPGGGKGHIRWVRTDDNENQILSALARIAAPFVLAVGFAAPRLDHALATLNILARRVGPPTILLTEADAVLACPARVTADLPRGTRLSLFPMGPARAEAQGLRLVWP